MSNPYEAPSLEASSKTLAVDRRRFGLVLMVLLAAWTGFVAVRIEVANAAAEFYIPGREKNEHGKWRMSRQGNEPRDILRKWVETAGLLQYPLATWLGMLAILRHRNAKSQQERVLPAICGVIALAALVLANYRQYFVSLGW